MSMQTSVMLKEATLLLEQQAKRIEALEAALQEIIDCQRVPTREQAESVTTIARAALALEQDQ